MASISQGHTNLIQAQVEDHTDTISPLPSQSFNSRQINTGTDEAAWQTFNLLSLGHLS